MQISRGDVIVADGKVTSIGQMSVELIARRTLRGVGPHLAMTIFSMQLTNCGRTVRNASRLNVFKVAIVVRKHLPN